jgi:RNA polymerase sigma-70 factor (ECF subfamily)
MCTETIPMSETRLSLLKRVRDLADGESWREFYAIYQPLIFSYLRGLGLKAQDADEVTQEVFRRLVEALPTFELDRTRGRFRTYLWKLTHNTLIDVMRRKTVRDKAEKEWIRRFCKLNESESQKLEKIFMDQHRERILKVVLPQVQATVSPTSWACFEGRMLRDLPAAAVAAELGISDKVVYVYAWRVLQEVRCRCAEHEEDLGDDSVADPS